MGQEWTRLSRWSFLAHLHVRCLHVPTSCPDIHLQPLYILAVEFPHQKQREFMMVQWVQDLHCHCYGHCCDVGSIPSSRTSTCCGHVPPPPHLPLPKILKLNFLKKRSRNSGGLLRLRPELSLHHSCCPSLVKIGQKASPDAVQARK